MTESQHTFVVRNPRQIEDATRIGALLATRHVVAKIVGMHDLRRTLSHVVSSDTVSVPQDASPVFRLAVSGARRRGARTIVIPDGVIFQGEVLTATPASRLISAYNHVALPRTARVLGMHGVVGSTDPDVFCVWGEGWREVAAANGAPRAQVTGAGRMAVLAEMPPVQQQTVLLCTQPLTQTRAQGPTRVWDEIVDRFTGEQGAVRVRFHPDDDRRPATATTRSVSDDLEQCSHVLAVSSSVLLEAAVAGRTPIRVELPGYIGPTNPFLQSPDLPVLSLNESHLSSETLLADVHQLSESWTPQRASALVTRFAGDTRRSDALVAQIIDDLHRRNDG